MNYNNCNGWNEYAGKLMRGLLCRDAACQNGRCRRKLVEVLRPQPQQALPGHAAETGRTCDLYWQGYMAGFYANNRCNQSAEAKGRLPRQQTGPLRLQTAAAPAITAIIAVIGTIAATAATAALKKLPLLK